MTRLSALLVVALVLFVGQVVQASGASAEQCQGKTVDPAFLGTNSDDSYSGGGAANVMDALDGYDYVSGMASGDTICMGLGRDEAAGDYPSSDNGADSIEGGGACDALAGDYGPDYVNGNDGDDTLNTWGGCNNAGNNGASGFIDGDSGDDDLHGGAGTDYLNSGPGDDTEDGGDGTDRCDQASAEQTFSCEIWV